MISSNLYNQRTFLRCGAQLPYLGRENKSSWMPFSVGMPSKMTLLLGPTNSLATYETVYTFQVSGGKGMEQEQLLPAR